MPSTYTPIATTTATSGITNVTFSSIPSTYTDLVLVMNIVSPSSGSSPYVRVTCNGDTGNNYSLTYVAGDGSSAYSGLAANTNGVIGSYTINPTGPSAGTTFIKMNFQNYSNSTTNKTVLTRAEGQDTAFTVAYVSLWRNTSTVTNISIDSITSGTYNVGSMFTLYGIKAA